MRAVRLLRAIPMTCPFPSYLILGFLGDMPLHVSLRVEAGGTRCYVITVYVPDPKRWSPDFREMCHLQTRRDRAGDHHGYPSTWGVHTNREGRSGRHL